MGRKVAGLLFFLGMGVALIIGWSAVFGFMGGFAHGVVYIIDE